MNEEIWNALGIEPTSDEREIKRAYARRLKEQRPDEDPRAFQELREAYEGRVAASGARSGPELGTSCCGAGGEAASGSGARR